MWASREEVFEAWYTECKAVGFAHGQKLYAMLLDYAQGRFFLDSADADALLRKAEEAGRIRRHPAGKVELTFSQRVAGVGGNSAAVIRRHKIVYPHFLGWEPVS